MAWFLKSIFHWACTFEHFSFVRYLCNLNDYGIILDLLKFLFLVHSMVASMVHRFLNNYRHGEYYRELAESSFVGSLPAREISRIPLFRFLWVEENRNHERV